MMTASEEWRPVVGVPGYEISSLGRCRSVDRWIECDRLSRHGTPFRSRRFYRGRLLSPYFNRYVEFGLGKSLRLRAHQMVAEAFLGPRPDGLWVLHGDGDPSNNSVENLRYGTPVENHDDRIRHGRPFTGERNGQAKLTASQVRAIKADTRFQHLIARSYGVSKSTINMIKRGATWSHIPSIDPIALAERIHAVSGDIEAGETIIKQARRMGPETPHDH